jgi:hypothetical protein
MAVQLVPMPEAVVATTVPDEPLDAVLARQVDEHWAKALVERPGLIDGQLFSVTEMSARGFTGRFVPYRRLVASLADPALAARLAVAPLAVTGRTVSSDGCAVLGRRASWSTQEPGQFEFVPSGSVDEEAVVDVDRVDPLLTLEEELLEELGVTRASVTRIVPQVLAIDDVIRVHDLVFDVYVELTAAELSASHRASTFDEHDRLELVPLAEVEHYPTAMLGALARAVLTLPFTKMEMP